MEIVVIIITLAYLNYKHLEHHSLSKELTFSIVGLIELKFDTKGLIMAYQDGVLNALTYFSSAVVFTVQNTRCRTGYQEPEIITHPLSACL